MTDSQPEEPTPGPPADNPSAAAKASAGSGGPASTSAQNVDQTAEEAAASVDPLSSDTKPRTPKWYQTRAFKTVFTIGIVIVAVIVVTRSIKPSEFEEAFKDMNPWWFLAALAAGAVTWVGAAIPMRVFSPKPISFKNAFLVQMSSSFVGVVAPAGLGSIALGIRFLMKQGLKSAQAVATIILMQLSQFITSFTLVILAILVVGISPDIHVKWDIVGIVAGAVVAGVLIALAIPKVRTWAITSIKKVWSRVYPEAIWAVKHPRQLAIAMGGALLQTAGFIAAFGFSLLAFGKSLSVLKVAATYLVANTLGSMIPVPGGVGSIEASLTLGLTSAGISAAVALSAAVTFRLATFYLQVPMGWVAFEYMQKKQLI